MIPYTSFSGASTETAVQIGYTIADILAKAGLGVLVYMIAVRKSIAEGYDSGAVGVATETRAATHG